jgi:hypothetical protein
MSCIGSTTRRIAASCCRNSKPRCVEVREQVAAVAIEFRMLVVQHGVLDRERMEPLPNSGPLS